MISALIKQFKPREVAPQTDKHMIFFSSMSVIDCKKPLVDSPVGRQFFRCDYCMKEVKAENNFILSLNKPSKSNLVNFPLCFTAAFTHIIQFINKQLSIVLQIIIG